MAESPDDPEPITVPIRCGFCGSAATITYVPDPNFVALWICPAIGCAVQNKAAGMRRVLRVEKRVEKPAG